MSNTRQQLETWLKSIDAYGDVLDVGGISLPIKGRINTWNVSKYVILDFVKDLNGNHADICIDLNKKLPSTVLDKFDIVFCLEVFEYIYDPVTALRSIFKLLKSNGLLYISTHFIFPHHHPWPIDYLRYTRSGIQRLLNVVGFEILEIKPRVSRNAEQLKNYLDLESKVVKFPEEIGHLVKARKNV